ncbi:hypothetical protein N7516_005300 [Penicillium verrucosum]|uniref:uncharacterized protein n=1 Tax=Penicillium verrucosum TaxID=60171 RepID=UPI0025454909|nr:uncharacterized protein N7516_005300 [Penicillium verrucosum]KAJ5945132.1 hypothetical protein N7516_005300 [Penicillium verrucosum]
MSLLSRLGDHLVPKCLATCQKTHTRKPGLIWMLSCMGLNHVGCLMHRHRGATGPLAYTVS